MCLLLLFIRKLSQWQFKQSEISLIKYLFLRKYKYKVMSWHFMHLNILGKFIEQTLCIKNFFIQLCRIL